MLHAMKSTYITVLLCLLGSIFVKVSANAVVGLTTSTFEHQTQAATGATTGNWFVMFYAPWCGHCQMLKPTWKDAATALKEQEEESYTTFADVDCTKELMVCKRFEVRGYPTLIYFHQGKMVKYNGSRTQSALLDFVNGGYKTAIESDNAEAVPPEISRWTLLIENMRKDFSEMIEHRKVFLTLLIVGSIVFGISIGYLLEGRSTDTKHDATPSSAGAAKTKDEKKDQ